MNLSANLISSPLVTGIIIAVVVVIVIAVIAWYISTRNNFVRLINNCEESLSGIDVYLKKRYDLIPNLVETVKGYTKHEGDTLERVISARNRAMSASGEGKVQAENELSGTLKSLFALTEAYPELKADGQFLSLQNQLKSIENDIAQARKYYNGNVKAYNNAIAMFPASIISGSMKLEKRSYFERTNDAERENVKVSF